MNKRSLTCVVLPLAILAVMAITAPLWAPTPSATPLRLEMFLAPQSTFAGARAMAFTLESKSFSRGGAIPRQYTCAGDDLSPELNWSDPPPETKSLALIADDPDAPSGTFTHWVLYELPPETRQLAEGAAQYQLPRGARQGRNDFGKTGYGGPCPPPGKPHRYFFKLCALDTRLELKPGASKQAVEQSIQGHVLAHAELMGTFQR